MRDLIFDIFNYTALEAEICVKWACDKIVKENFKNKKEGTTKNVYTISHNFPPKEETNGQIDSAKNETILIIFGVQNAEEISQFHKIIHSPTSTE